MVNNQHTQSTHNVFERQLHTANGQQPLRGVRQDKTASKRARAAMPQPVVQKNMARTRQLNRLSPRSQNYFKHKNHSKNRQTVQISGWGRPQLKAELKRIAEREGLSLSQTVIAALEEWVRQQLHIQHAVLLQPIIEQAIRKQMRGISTRLAWLVVRVAFDAGQTRSIVTNILGRQPGVSEDELKHILDESNKTAKGNITRRTPQIAELIEAVEQWIVTEEGEQQTHE